MTKGLLVAATLVALSAAAHGAAPEAATADANAPGDAFYVFLTGNALGSLSPCGCSVHQLGGLDKRAAVWKDVSADRTVILDTGNFLKKTGEQDLVKFDIMMQALSMMGYDVVNFSAADLGTASSRGYLGGTTFKAITASDVTGNNTPAVFTKELQVGGTAVTVRVASMDPSQKAGHDVDELLPREASGRALNILIYNAYFEKIDVNLLAGGAVDVLVCLSGTDEPERLDVKRDKPFVIAVGRAGKHVGKLAARLDDGKFWLSYEDKPVVDTLPSQPELVNLYKNYQQIVKEEKLIDQYPRLPVPGRLEYTGSKSCVVCHEEQYKKWTDAKHSHAWKTLVDAGSDFDPECVVCHTVGFKYQGGFVSAKKTPELRNVGCEECHGPGSKHIESLGKMKTEVPKPDQCTVCHTVENSVNYSGHEAEYRSKIVHWKEQTDANSVKK
jgi:hypothetical protein